MQDLAPMTIFVNLPLYVGFFSSSQYGTGVLHQQFSLPHSISVGCSVIANNNSQFWHKKLGHPNTIILKHLMKHGYLSNTNEFSSLSFDCAPCKLGKSKSLPFPL
jgi:hypothetical protein